MSPRHSCRPFVPLLTIFRRIIFQKNNSMTFHEIFHQISTVCFDLCLLIFGKYVSSLNLAFLQKNSLHSVVLVTEFYVRANDFQEF